MPYANTIDALHFTALTMNVLNMDEPLSLLTEAVFGQRPALFPGTDRIEFGRETRAAAVAPYIPAEADAVIVGDRTTSLETIDSVNMALRKSIRAGDFAHDRGAGEAVHITAAGVSRVNGLQSRIDRYQRDMVVRMNYTAEWWASQAILGSVTYSQSAYDAFTINFGRPAGNTIVVSPYWTDPAATITQNIQTAKKVVSAAEGVNVNLALCGREAAAAIRNSTQLRGILDIARYDTGNVLDSSAPYMNKGSITYIGRLNGIAFWEVDHDIPMPGGNVPVIRAKFIEFMHVGPDAMAQRVIAPIFDLKVNNGAPINTEVFSKSWEVDYPSQRWILVQKRETMLPLKPGCYASIQVVA